MSSFDLNIPAMVRAPVAAPVNVPPPVIDSRPLPMDAAASGMIFLRHTEQGWFARFFGVQGVGGQNEIPLPAPIDATLAQVVDRLQGRFPKTWLLVAP